MRISLQRPVVCATMRKASDLSITGFSNHQRLIGVIMAKYIVIHGIRIDKDHANFVPETFGRLTTIGPKFRIGSRSYQACHCLCGNIKVIRSTALGYDTRSCGCVGDEKRSERCTRHGKVKTREYSIWKNMKSRCLRATNDEFHNYGGRGIRVCDRWLEPNGQGFINFLKDMGPAPSPKCTIDRYPNKNGNYEPGNCRWATMTEQNRNRRNNRMLTAFGKTQCLSAWAEEYSISKHTLRSRLNKKWEAEKALTHPVK